MLIGCQITFAREPISFLRIAAINQGGKWMIGCKPSDDSLSGGKLAILMGDYCDREAGFVPLPYHTKQLGFAGGLRQCCTDIIRLSHGASSSGKVYRGSFIPGLHDVCMVFEKA